MNSRLLAMLFAVGTLGGGAILLYTPQPSTRTMAELRDAGVAAGQSVVVTCPERLTPKTKRRIKDAQPGALRPKQSYARIARVAKCFGSEWLDGGLGNCIKPSDGASLAPFTRETLLPDGGRALVPKQAELVVPSLRQNMLNLDADGGDDGGEDDVGDSLQYDPLSCTLSRCSTFDAGDGTGFCTRLNRLFLVQPPNMIPLCIGPDGGWDDEAGEPGHMPAPDCRFTGPYGTADGGPRWAGCNSLPAQYAVGSACVPVEASVVSGDLINEEWL